MKLIYKGGSTMGKQQKKQRFSSEVILTIIVLMITIAFLLIIAFVKINSNVTLYGSMRVPNVDAPTGLDIAREPDSIPCEDMSTGKEGVTLTQKQLLLQKSGLEPDENSVNWALAEGISSYVEYSVGVNANNFAGYDFNEVQQVMAKRLVNLLNSRKYENDFQRLVTQDVGAHGWNCVSTNRPNVKETTLINVLKALYSNSYEIPENVYYQHSFVYSENAGNVTKIGNKFIVSNAYQAFDLLCEKGLSDTLYPYASYTYIDPYGTPRLLIFCGSYDDI